ncbi:conserved hypothetical protein [Hyphomicrobiales bacterium]|nr:conserved hypothetical protein [Hyphomicrobiales bacterium]CAI0342822.1 conserved hypothetical protein [Hyphomicrobiales bacterium]
MARSFTREQFYKLVWSKPLTHLAKEFYISDVALHKICRKHDIPNPPLGWWAKKEAGKPVEQTPLPKAKAGAAREIIIANADLSKEAATLSAVREQARVQASSGDDADDAPQHPIIARTLVALRKAKNPEKGLISVSERGLIHCTVAPASINRIAIGLPRMARAIALQGFQLVEDGKRVCFASKAESIGFSITETVKRVPHVLTPAEAKEQAAYEKREERRRARRNSWGHDFEMPPRFQEWDYQPTGQLAIELEPVWGDVRPRSTFRDGKIQRFETMASDVAVAVAVLAAAKTDARLKQEAKERKRQEERDRRDQGLRAEHIQERRVATFGTILTELEKLDRMRQLVAALNSQLASSETARVANFVTWANDRLSELEAAISAATLEEKFEEARLFGDDDDYKFVSPPYYGY